MNWILVPFRTRIHQGGWLGKKIIWPGEAENLKLENLSEKLVSVNINGRQYKKQSRGGSFSQKIETANSAQLS